MKTIPLPINSKPYQNVDEMTLNEASSQLLDGFIDDLGNSVTRSGLEDFTTLGSVRASAGGYWWEALGVTIFVSDGRTYKISDETGTVVDITGDLLLTDGRPTFADNGTYLVIANGGQMVYTDGTTPTAYITDSDAPTQVTHVAFLDYYLIVNRVGTGLFYYAIFIGAPTVWIAVAVYSAESNPDNIISLYVNRRIIYLIGTQSIEFWINDGISPFSRQDGTIASRGGMSGYSSVVVNEIFYMFDERRRFLAINGTTPSELSTPFDRVIEQFTDVSDCFADYIKDNGKDFIYLTFPAEQRTLVYDIAGQYWAEATFYDEITHGRTRFIGNCYVYARGWGKSLWGSYRDDKIYEMSPRFYSDAGVTRRFSKRTGFIDHGFPNKRKRSYRITMRLKTGVGIGASGSEVPYARLRFRDVQKDGSMFWSNYYLIPLGVRGERGFLFTIRGLGSYYARQYEIDCSAAVPLVIGECYEDLDVNEF